MLRSAKRVSKHEAAPSFETPRYARLLRMRRAESGDFFSSEGLHAAAHDSSFSRAARPRGLVRIPSRTNARGRSAERRHLDPRLSGRGARGSLTARTPLGAPPRFLPGVPEDLPAQPRAALPEACPLTRDATPTSELLAGRS
jgi:hypothetical protein